MKINEEFGPSWRSAYLGPCQQTFWGQDFEIQSNHSGCLRSGAAVADEDVIADEDVLVEATELKPELKQESNTSGLQKVWSPCWPVLWDQDH